MVAMPSAGWPLFKLPRTAPGAALRERSALAIVDHESVHESTLVERIELLND